MLAAPQAFAVLGLLRGAQRLKRTVQNAAAKHAKRPEDFAPLLRVIKVACSPLWSPVCSMSPVICSMHTCCCSPEACAQDLPLSEGTARILSDSLNADGEVCRPCHQGIRQPRPLTTGQPEAGCVGPQIDARCSDELASARAQIARIRERLVSLLKGRPGELQSG